MGAQGSLCLFDRWRIASCKEWRPSMSGLGERGGLVVEECLPTCT